MPRHLLLAIALAGCHGSTPATQPVPPPSTAAKTCTDAGAQAAALVRAEAPDQPTDEAALAQQCVDEAWSQELIDCVVAATTAHEADACFADLVAAAPVCQTLASITEAGRDPRYASIQGAASTDQPYDFVSTVTVTGATSCGIYTRSTPAKVQCDLLQTDDPVAANEAYGQVADAVNTCLTLTGWTFEDLGRGNLKWTPPDAALPEVFIQVYTMSGVTYLRVNFGGLT